MQVIPIKRALLSVANKTGVVDLAKELATLNIEIISTGGTSKLLQEANIPHRPVEALTGFSDLLDGRVKTLHPKIHGGILGKRDHHQHEALQHNIEWIDLVVVNFYPFAEGVKQIGITWDEAIELIDVGGPTMVRAAAKNHNWVGVVVDPNDYMSVATELQTHKGLQLSTRKRLAHKAFALTSYYDGLIRDYLSQNEVEDEAPAKLILELQKNSELRYGENPHQKAYTYSFNKKNVGLLSAVQHQGKPLSYNNLLDAEAACDCLAEFEQPSCVIIKHTNPCGVASAESIEEAYAKAFAADSTSAFGGIIAVNRQCSKALAELIIKQFSEVVLAPHFTEEALQVFLTKPNIRVLNLPNKNTDIWEMRFITGGVLLQQKDLAKLHAQQLQMMTDVQPSYEQMNSLLFAWNVVKHVKSNAIVVAKDNITLGIGRGQVSRIDAVKLALEKAGDEARGAVLASDAFFPFRDNIDIIAKAGISAIIQPPGSIRDEEVIAACNEYGIALVFTAQRCFKH